MQTEVIEKRDNLSKWLKWGGIGAAAFVLSPVIFMVIQGIAGLAIAGALGVTVVTLAPWVGLKLANLRYRLNDAENVSHIKKVTKSAAENPIETLTAMLAAKNKAFIEFKQKVELAAAARDSFKQKVAKFKEQWPNRAAEFEAHYGRVVEMVEKQKKALGEARASLDAGAIKLEEMKAYWVMSQEVLVLNRAANMDTGDAFERLKLDTSCDAVFASMNQAFSQLEIAASLEAQYNTATLAATLLCSP